MDEIVVGATRKTIQVSFTDTNGVPLNLAGATVKLQGVSLDLPSKSLNITGTLHDSTNGIGWWTSAGTMISTGDLAGKTSALYTFRGQVTDGSSLIDWGPTFQILFVAPPAV